MSEDGESSNGDGADIGTDAEAGIIGGDAKMSDVDLANTNAARYRDLASQSADNRGWLYRNIVPVLALIVVVYAFAFFLIAIKINLGDPDRKEITIYIINGVQTLLALVLGYFFGSSKGSADKARYIEKNNSGRRKS